MKTTPQLSCVAEDWMLLEGGVLYGFTRFYATKWKTTILHIVSGSFGVSVLFSPHLDPFIVDPVQYWGFGPQDPVQLFLHRRF